jgi:hypothetical protein
MTTMRAIGLKKKILDIITLYEEGDNHNEGAFDNACEICRILESLRQALRSNALSR